MKVTVAILLALAILLPLMGSVDAQSDDGVEVADDEAKAEELIKEAEISKDEGDSESDAPAADDAETPNEKGERKIELEDLQLWKNMDLNKDGKLTVAEYERFSRSPGAQKFVRNMKEHKAVEQWAAKIGIDVAKAKAAMMLGANAQRRRAYLHRQRNARVLAHRRRAAIARRNRVAAYKRRQRRTNFWAKLGINPFLQQQYYTAMKQSAGRRGGEL